MLLDRIRPATKPAEPKGLHDRVSGVAQLRGGAGREKRLVPRGAAEVLWGWERDRQPAARQPQGAPASLLRGPEGRSPRRDRALLPGAPASILEAGRLRRDS